MPIWVHTGDIGNTFGSRIGTDDAYLLVIKDIFKFREQEPSLKSKTVLRFLL